MCVFIHCLCGWLMSRSSLLVWPSDAWAMLLSHRLLALHVWQSHTAFVLFYLFASGFIFSFYFYLRNDHKTHLMARLQYLLCIIVDCFLYNLYNPDPACSVCLISVQRCLLHVFCCAVAGMWHSGIDCSWYIGVLLVLVSGTIRHGRHDGPLAGVANQLCPAVGHGHSFVCNSNQVGPVFSSTHVVRCWSVATWSVVVARAERRISESSVTVESGNWFASLVCTLAVAAVTVWTRWCCRIWRTVTCSRYCTSTAVSAIQHGKYLSQS